MGQVGMYWWNILIFENVSDKIAVAGSQSAIKKLHKSRSSELKSESESILPKSKKTVDPEDEPIPGTVSIGNKGSKGLNPKTTRRQNTHVVAVDVSWNSTGVIASSTDVDIGLFHVNPRFLGPVTYVITSAACAPTQKTVRSAILDLNTNTMVHRTDTVELKPGKTLPVFLGSSVCSGDIKPILGEAKTVQAFFNATMVYPDHCVVMKRKNLPVARIESDKQLVLDSPHNARESVVVDIGAWYGVVLHSTLCKCLMSRRKFHNATVTEFHSKFGTKPHDKKEGPIGAYFADTNQLLSVTDAKLEMLLPYYAAACELSEESTKIIDHLKRQLAKGSSILIRSSDVGYVPKGMQRALIEVKYTNPARTGQLASAGKISD